MDIVASRAGTGQISLGPATRKLSPGEAGFYHGGGIPGLSCGDCRYNVEETCFIVDTAVMPGDYCDEFQPGFEKGHIPSPSGQTLNVMSQQRGFYGAEVPCALYITRVAKDPKTGRKTWFATSSGTKVDAYGERMSVDLFRDFVRRIEGNEDVPEVFASVAWKGGNPYLGVAHYLDLDGYGIVGDTDKVYIDSTVLKARGSFRDTPLAEAAYLAIRRDIDQEIPVENRVRISIAFVDWGHEHLGQGTFERKALTDQCVLCDDGVGGKVYRRGHLVHLALTRRPAYPDTDILLEERSMTTKRDDAASIVGDTEAEELEKRASLTQRAGAALVLKGKEGETAEPPTAPAEPPAEPAPSEPGAAYLGGAMTLAEAEAFIGKMTPRPLMDAFGVLAAVLANIAASPKVGNKALAIRTEIANFQSSLDVQQAQIIQRIAPLLAQEGVTLMGNTPETPETTPAEPVERAEPKAPDAAPPAEAQAAAPAAAPPEAAKPEVQHPLGEALMAFRAAFDAAMATAVSPDERLVMLQPALDNLADVVIRIIAGATPAAAPAQQPAVGPAAAAPAGQMMASASLTDEQFDQRIDLRLNQHIAPIRAAVEQMQVLMQQVVRPSAPTVDATIRVEQPVSRPHSRAVRLTPRSLSVTQRAAAPATFSALPQSNRMSPLTRRIRASVGIQDIPES